MTGATRRATLFVVGLVAIAALPFAGRALRADRGERCEFDGVAIQAVHRVRLVDDDGSSRRFCCIDCAKRWLAESGRRTRETFVTDETSGREVRGQDAWFVRSRVAAFAVTGSYVHVFADEKDARRHADAFGGVVLSSREQGLPGGD